MASPQTDKCPRSLWLSLRRTDPDGSVHFSKFRTSCNCWNCPVCSKKLVDRLTEKVRKFFAKKSIYHYTLTVRNTGQSPERSVQHGKKSFARFRKKLNRLYGRFAYIYFVEFTKAGIVHYHLLSDQDINKTVIKTLWFQSTRNSFMIEKSKFAENHSVIRRYVLKYVLKQVSEYNGSTIHGQKVYTYSSHFWNPPKVKMGWELLGIFDDGMDCLISHYQSIREYRIFHSAVGRPPPILIQRNGYSDCTFRFSQEETIG